MPHSIGACWGFLVVGLALLHCNSLWIVACSCVKKKGLCKNYIYYFMYYTYCVPFHFLYPLGEISNTYCKAPLSVNLLPLSPRESSSCVLRENVSNCISLWSLFSSERTLTSPLVILSGKNISHSLLRRQSLWHSDLGSSKYLSAQKLWQEA